MSRDDFQLICRHAIVLLGSWFLGTVLVLLTAPLPSIGTPDANTLAQLARQVPLFISGYALFFVADCAIALLGISVVVWLKPTGYRGPAIISLFLVSGLLGMLVDLQMLATAQLIRTGSPLLQPESAAAFFSWMNTFSNWLSAASFLPPAIACLLIVPAARAAGIISAWISLNQFGAFYQFLTGIFAISAFLINQPTIIDASIVLAVLGMPIFTAVWLIWMIRLIKPTINTTNLSSL